MNSFFYRKLHKLTCGAICKQREKSIFQQKNYELNCRIKFKVLIEFMCITRHQKKNRANCQSIWKTASNFLINLVIQRVQTGNWSRKWRWHCLLWVCVFIYFNLTHSHHKSFWHFNLTQHDLILATPRISLCRDFMIKIFKSDRLGLQFCSQHLKCYCAFHRHCDDCHGVISIDTDWTQFIPIFRFILFYFKGLFTVSHISLTEQLRILMCASINNMHPN